MYSNNHFNALERLRSNSGVTPEQLRMKGKPLRRSKGWICPICSLESKRRWNIQRHFRRQHGESRLEPLEALTMETREEKYRKHIVEEQGKLVQNISKQFGPSQYTVIFLPILSLSIIHCWTISEAPLLLGLILYMLIYTTQVEQIS